MKPTLASILLITITAVLGAYAQQLEPLSENIRVAEQPDSPVQLKIEGATPSVSQFKSFRYSTRNAGTKAIRSIILLDKRPDFWTTRILGLPGTSSGAIGFETGLGAGKSVKHLGSITRVDSKSGAVVTDDFIDLSVDYVLFYDGTAWGPDTARESESLVGIIEGQRRLYADVKKLSIEKDEATLKEIINRQVPVLGDTENLSAKRKEGIRRGYFAGILALRADLQGRGNLNGLHSWIRDIERELGLVPLVDDKRKQISMRYGYGINNPVKFIGLSRGGRTFSFDERFAADGDWLTGTAIQIKNESGKTIRSVSLGIDFPETLRIGTRMGSNVRYGPNPVTQAETPKQPRVLPEQTFDIVINEQFPGEIMRFLAREQDFSTISRAIIDLSYIDFEDGTRWSGGQWQKQDPNDLKRWVPFTLESK